MFQNNEDRIVKSLETIAECMVKSNEMAKEALEKSNWLYGASMAMMKESQIIIKPDYETYKDCPLQTPDSNTPTMHDGCEDETNEEGDDMPL